MSDDNKPTKTHEAQIGNAHVTVTRVNEPSIRPDEKDGNYFSSVSYRVYNSKDVHVASPTWTNVGSREKTEAFIREHVKKANE